MQKLVTDSLDWQCRLGLAKTLYYIEPKVEPHNVQAIVWWLAATLGCSIPKWPLMGVGAWGLQSVFCGKIPIFL